MTKYGGSVLYDENMKKIYIVDNEGIHYLKEEGMYLIGIPYDLSTEYY